MPERGGKRWACMMHNPISGNNREGGIKKGDLKMFWSKTLEDKLIAIEEGDKKKIATAEKEMQQNRAAFETLSVACLQRQAMLNVRSEAPGPRNAIRTEVIENMKSQQEADSHKMEKLAEPLEQIDRIRQEIASRRNGILTEVITWLGRVSPQLSEKEMRSTREHLESLQSMRDLLDFALPLIKKFENDPTIQCSLFRFENVARGILGEPLPA
jgi:hypothetical protein